MATTFLSSGFETGDFSDWTTSDVGTGDTLEVTSAASYRGNYMARITANGSGASDDYGYTRYTLAVDQTELYARMYFKINALPTVNNEEWMIITVIGSINTLVVGEIFNDAGTPKFRLAYWSDAVGNYQYIAGTDTVQIDTWYCVEIHVKVDAANAEADMWIDGTNIANASGFDNDSRGNCHNSETGFRLNNLAAATFILDWDNCKIADAYIGVEVMAEAIKNFHPHGGL